MKDYDVVDLGTSQPRSVLADVSEASQGRRLA